jgi:ankyrin repeat protein
MDKIEKELPVYRGMKGFKLSEEEENLSIKLEELSGLPKQTRGGLPKETRQNPLFQALQNGHSKIAIRLINLGTNLDEVGPDGMNILHRACAIGNSEVVTLLLKKKLDLNEATEDGFLPLHLALIKGHSEIAIQLINSGTNLDKVRPDGMNILHYACIFGNSKVVELLLIKKPDLLDTATKDGFLPLHIALDKRHFEIAIQLINFGTNLEKVMPSNGMSIFHNACAIGNSEIVKLLLEKKPGVYKATSEDEYKPIDIACLKGHLDIVKILFNAGANADGNIIKIMQNKETQNKEAMIKLIEEITKKENIKKRDDNLRQPPSNMTTLPSIGLTNLNLNGSLTGR